MKTSLIMLILASSLIGVDLKNSEPPIILNMRPGEQPHTLCIDYGTKDGNDVEMRVCYRITPGEGGFFISKPYKWAVDRNHNGTYDEDEWKIDLNEFKKVVGEQKK